MRYLPLFVALLLLLELNAQREGTLGVIRTDIDGGTYGMSYRNTGTDKSEFLGFELMMAGSKFIPSDFGAASQGKPNTLIMGTWLLYSRPAWHVEKLRWYGKVGGMVYSLLEDLPDLEGTRANVTLLELGASIEYMASQRIGASVDILPTYYRTTFTGALGDFLNEQADRNGWHVSVYLRILYSFTAR